MSSFEALKRKRLIKGEQRVWKTWRKLAFEDLLFHEFFFISHFRRETSFLPCLISWMTVTNIREKKWRLLCVNLLEQPFFSLFILFFLSTINVLRVSLEVFPDSHCFLSYVAAVYLEIAGFRQNRIFIDSSNFLGEKRFLVFWFVRKKRVSFSLNLALSKADVWKYWI